MKCSSFRTALVALLIIAFQPAAHAQSQNPFTAAREALKKSMEEAKRQMQGQPASAPGSAASATANGSQSAADLLGPQPTQPTEPPDSTGTAARSAELAAATGKYDIAGLRVGMALKDATQTLKAHNPGLQMQQHVVSYPDLVGNLLYGLTFTSPGERILLELTMPPSPIVVSRISRALDFAREDAPTQQTLVAELTRKYGPPSYDQGASQFNDVNQRKLLWIDDLAGRRLSADEIITTCNDHANRFSIIGESSQTEPVQYRPDAMHSKLEASKSMKGLSTCLDHRMMEARLTRCCRNGLAAPDLAGGLTVVHYEAPLDVNATGATHQMLLEAARKRDQKEQQDAQTNRPKL
jgi:hypothetical protein